MSILFVVCVVSEGFQFVGVPTSRSQNVQVDEADQESVSQILVIRRLQLRCAAYLCL
jgi:hypothetical protein